MRPNPKPLSERRHRRQQIRDLLDPVSPTHGAPLFMDLVAPIVADAGLASHRLLDGRLLVAGDGTEHHYSEAICCPQCSTRTLADGKTQSDRTALTPVIVAPGQKKVLPLASEFVVPQDGQANNIWPICSRASSCRLFSRTRCWICTINAISACAGNDHRDAQSLNTCVR